MDKKALSELVRDWGIAFAITGVAVMLWQLATPKPPTEGYAPPLDAPHVDGRAFDLDDENAKAYVVNYWATWCQPCRAEIPDFAAFAKAHPEVGVYGVSVDDLDPMQLEAASRRLGITYDVLHDKGGAAATEWGVRSFPTTFVLDRKRRIVGVRVGRTSRETLEELVAKAR